MNKISTTLSERPYGKHYFKAAIIMCESMLLGSMLSYLESWINLTKKDLEKLKKLDTFLKRNVLNQEGNPSKVFMYLELGVIPVWFVMMEKKK